MNRDWASFLAHLLDGMPAAWSVKDPLAVLARWVTLPKTDSTYDEEKDPAKAGYLRVYQRIRQVVA